MNLDDQTSPPGSPEPTANPFAVGSDRSSPQQSSSELIGRALRLRCPRCGQSKMFRGLLQMEERCPACGLVYERAPGYFLGSIYVNYGFTAVGLIILYVALHFGLDWTNRQLTWPLVSFCVLFPTFNFRYARALWLAFDGQWESLDS